MKNRKWLLVALDLLLLAGLFWVARYWHSRSFGLYEDDLTIIPGAIQMKFGELLKFIGSYIVTFQGQERPLHHSFIRFFSWAGWRLAGLWGPYLLGYLIEVVNITLFYWLMRRVADRPFAVLAGLAYLLFSADTTQAFLTHSLGLQPSITLLLLACHAYLSNRRIPAYLLAFIILFSYETPFLVFLAAPLLKKKWNRRLLKEWVFHALILGAVLVCVYFQRLAVGEGRVVSMGPHQMLTIALNHMLLGPITALRTYLTRPLRPLIDFNPGIGLAAGLSFVVIAIYLWNLITASPLGLRQLWNSLRKSSSAPLPEQVKSLGRTLMAGLVMLVMAYPLTFTVDATITNGRNTRVHAAAVLGAAILVACAVQFLLMLLAKWKTWRLGILVVSLFFALLVGYGFVLQADYAHAWQLEKEFWTELLPLIPDAGDGTVILVQPDGLEDVYQIQANTWNLTSVLDQLYVFPEEMGNPPRVYRLADDWEQILGSPNGQIQVSSVSAFIPSDWGGEYDSRQIIFIETSSGNLVRRSQPLNLNGKEYDLKPVSDPVVPALPHQVLYDLMVIQP